MLVWGPIPAMLASLKPTAPPEPKQSHTASLAFTMVPRGMSSVTLGKPTPCRLEQGLAQPAYTLRNKS